MRKYKKGCVVWRRIDLLENSVFLLNAVPYRVKTFDFYLSKLYLLHPSSFSVSLSSYYLQRYQHHVT